MKLSFGLLSLFVPTALAVDTMAVADAQRELQSLFPADLSPLEREWFVDDPNLAYNPVDKVFTLTTEVGMGNSGLLGQSSFQKYSFEAFLDCPNGDPVYNGATEILTSELFDPLSTGQLVSYFFLFSTFFSGPNALGGAATFEQLEGPNIPRLLESSALFQILPGITSTTAYSETGGVGTAEFCLRVGSWDFQEFLGVSLLLLEPILINFKQLKVTVTYDLTDDFVVESFNTEVVASTEATANDSFETVARLCANQFPGNSEPFNAGDQICIEVCPTTDDDQFVDVSSIDSLFLKVGVPGSTANLEMGVIDPNPFNVQLSTVLDQICNVDSCCRVSFLLNGDFFPVGVDSTGGINEAEVVGEGSATMTQLRRHLGSTTRALQSSGSTSSEFDTKFNIELESPEDSSANQDATLTGVAAAAAGAIGAVLML